MRMLSESLIYYTNQTNDLKKFKMHNLKKNIVF